MNPIDKSGPPDPNEGVNALQGPSCSQHHDSSLEISVVLKVGQGLFSKGKYPPPLPNPLFTGVEPFSPPSWEPLWSEKC